ncbi:hypothetical protein AB6A40_004504 [Gnathostoma spinigerum]|uniref:C2H2-type domain-containing protein n=1 Tax=Gnathostoma spinigerum TaxID=75299 RepID=A0ABD6ECQ1_9BILA
MSRSEVFTTTTYYTTEFQMRSLDEICARLRQTKSSGGSGTQGDPGSGKNDSVVGSRKRKATQPCAHQNRARPSFSFDECGERSDVCADMNSRNTIDAGILQLPVELITPIDSPSPSSNDELSYVPSSKNVGNECKSRLFGGPSETFDSSPATVEDHGESTQSNHSTEYGLLRDNSSKSCRKKAMQSGQCGRPFCKLRKKLHYHCNFCEQGFGDLERLLPHLQKHYTNASSGGCRQSGAPSPKPQLAVSSSPSSDLSNILVNMSAFGAPIHLSLPTNNHSSQTSSSRSVSDSNSSLVLKSTPNLASNAGVIRDGGWSFVSENFGDKTVSEVDAELEQTRGIYGNDVPKERTFKFIDCTYEAMKAVTRREGASVDEFDNSECRKLER